MSHFKIIIDTCLLSGPYFCGITTKMAESPNWKAKQKRYKELQKILTTQSDSEHFLIGTKMKKEFTDLLKNPNGGLDFMRWYTNCVSTGDKSIKINFKIDKKKNEIELNPDDKIFDIYMEEYKRKNKSQFINYKNRLWEEAKGNKPKKCKIDDWHIIAACGKYEVFFVHTIDSRLEFVLLPLLEEFHKDSHNVKKVYGRNYYMDFVTNI